MSGVWTLLALALLILMSWPCAIELNALPHLQSNAAKTQDIAAQDGSVMICACTKSVS